MSRGYGVLRAGLLLVGMGCGGAVSAQGVSGLEPFATVSVGRLDNPWAFDRWFGASGKGPAPVLGVGAELRTGPSTRLAGFWQRAWDINDDGADIDFFLGEVRQRLDDVPGVWIGFGGGRARGRSRKESWVQTLSLGKSLGKTSFAELRLVADERDGRMVSFGVGWRLGGFR